MEKHEATDNESTSKDAILDCLTLAKCRYGLKCMSQLSAFSKVINPDLEMYRISACKPGWFPEAYIPLYKSKDKAIRALLKVLQEGDFQGSVISKTIAFPKRVKGISGTV